MDTKSPNIILLLIIILAAAGVVGGVAYYGLKEKPSFLQSEPTTEQPTGETSYFGTGSDYYQDESSYPTATEVVWQGNEALDTFLDSYQYGNGNTSSAVSSSPSPGESTLAINDVAASYWKAYNEAEQSKSSYKEVSLQAVSGQPLLLSYLLAGLDIKISSGVYNYLDPINYKAIFCYRSSDITGKGFIFSTKKGAGSDYYESFYSRLGSALQSWESSMFNGLGSAFYPDSSFEETPQFEEVSHKDKYEFMPGLTRRQAFLQDEAGESHYLGYTYFDERIFMATSQNCLQKMTDVYSPQPD